MGHIIHEKYVRVLKQIEFKSKDNIKSLQGCMDMSQWGVKLEILYEMRSYHVYNNPRFLLTVWKHFVTQNQSMKENKGNSVQ